MDLLAYEMEKMMKAKLSDGKHYLGASVYTAHQDISPGELANRQDIIARKTFALKKQLKEEEVSLRIVSGKEAQLSSVIVKKNQLLSDKGMELLVLLDHDQIWVGQTQAVQDFQGFSDRDFGRPFRDDWSGMLPPKLARIMLNLAGMKLDGLTVLDPFCGSGTVVQEAALLGATKVLGSDLSKKAIMDSIGNISWLKEEFSLQTDIRFEQVDAVELSTWLPENFIDIIATEPFLGEPVRAKLSKSEIKERQDALSRLYDDALVQMHNVLKPGGMLVMIFPFIDNSRLPLPRHLCRLFEQVIIDENLVSTPRLGIDYQRPGQKVGREIMVLRKK
jgi:tRNA G10  N-methylase Trm11